MFVVLGHADSFSPILPLACLLRAEEIKAQFHGWNWKAKNSWKFSAEHVRSAIKHFLEASPSCLKKIFRMNTFWHFSSSSWELTMSKKRKSFWNFRAMQNLWSNELFSTIMRYLQLVISYLKRNPLLLRNGMKSLELLPHLLAEWWTYRKTTQRCWVCNFEQTGKSLEWLISSDSLRLIKNFCRWSELFRMREHELMHFKTNRI